MHTSCLHAWGNFSKHEVVIEAFTHLSSVMRSSFAVWEDGENGQGRGEKRQEGKGDQEEDGG